VDIAESNDSFKEESKRDDSLKEELKKSLSIKHAEVEVHRYDPPDSFDPLLI